MIFTILDMKSGSSDKCQDNGFQRGPGRREIHLGTVYSTSRASFSNLHHIALNNAIQMYRKTNQRVAVPGEAHKTTPNQIIGCVPGTKE